MSKLALIILITFGSIAVFGVFAMQHNANSSGACLAATSAGIAQCPGLASPMTVAFHFDAMRSYSAAYLIPIVFVLLLAVFGTKEFFNKKRLREELLFKRNSFSENQFRGYIPSSEFQIRRWRYSCERRDRSAA